MIVYKVVRRRNRHLMSCFAEPRIAIRYRKGVVNKPIYEFAPLAAFRSIEAARKFCGEYNDQGLLEIWKAEAVISRKKPRYTDGLSSYSGTGYSNKRLDELMEELWTSEYRRYKIDFASRELRVPSGTVMCKSIKLLIKVDIYG